VFNGEPHDDVLECADMIKIQMALNAGGGMCRLGRRLAAWTLLPSIVKQVYGDMNHLGYWVQILDF